MTETADDKSWWADVEYLRPDGTSTGATTAVRSRMVEPADRPDEDHPADGEPCVRRGRITGRPIESASLPQEPAAVLRRADAAAFADAMDLDGAFAAPAATPRSREIVLSRARGPVADEQAQAEPLTEGDEALVVRGHADLDRRTVLITGNPGIHGQLTERRALRELQPRRSRSAVERVGRHPDRIAMWVVLLGLFLVLIAATSSSAGAA